MIRERHERTITRDNVPCERVESDGRNRYQQRWLAQVYPGHDRWLSKMKIAERKREVE